MFIMMSRLSKDMLSTLITLSTLNIIILTRIFYIYITKIVSLDRSFVLNLCNSQYNQFYCLSYLQTLVYSSKKFITLVYLCLYLMLLIEQSLYFEHRLFTEYQKFSFNHVFTIKTSYIRTTRRLY